MEMFMKWKEMFKYIIIIWSDYFGDISFIL